MRSRHEFILIFIVIVPLLDHGILQFETCLKLNILSSPSLDPPHTTPGPRLSPRAMMFPFLRPLQPTLLISPKLALVPGRNSQCPCGIKTW